MLVMPMCAKISFQAKDDEWLDGLAEVNKFFMDDEIYPTGPIAFTRRSIGLGEHAYSAYISLNDEINAIPELNIEYEEILLIHPTVSGKCFEEKEFDKVYKEIESYCRDHDFKLDLNEPFYHVMVDYFGGTVFEIHAKLDISDEELDLGELYEQG